MPSITDGGIRIFSATTKESLEDQLNTFFFFFMATDNKKKILIQPPVFIIDSGTFYSMIYYKTANS